MCIAENDACGCDAIQVILGCSVGKGNLLFHMRGKQAFSFYRRGTGKSVRLVLLPKPEGIGKGQSPVPVDATAIGADAGRRAGAGVGRLCATARLGRGAGAVAAAGGAAG